MFVARNRESSERGVIIRPTAGFEADQEPSRMQRAGAGFSLLHSSDLRLPRGRLSLPGQALCYIEQVRFQILARTLSVENNQ